MQVVSMLNTMYTLFDTLSEKHRVFKVSLGLLDLFRSGGKQQWCSLTDAPLQVETIGDAYMVVAGAPEKTKYHAHNICDMALDMVRSIDHLKDPSNGNNIQIRVGGWSAAHVGLLTITVVLSPLCPAGCRDPLWNGRGRCGGT